MLFISNQVIAIKFSYQGEIQKFTVELWISTYFNGAFHCNLTVKFPSNLFSQKADHIIKWGLSNLSYQIYIINK